MMNTGILLFVERAELAKVVGEKELAQSGLVDTGLSTEGEKILPVDLMITGTVINLNKKGQISARVIKANTGELYLSKSVEFEQNNPPVMTESGSEKSIGQKAAPNSNAADNPEAIVLYKNSPDKLDKINRAFFTLENMSRNRPLIFLMAVIDDSEMEMLKSKKPRLAHSIMQRKTQLAKNKPEVLVRVENMKKNIALMKDSYPSRYKTVMDLKEDVIAHPKRNKK